MVAHADVTIRPKCIDGTCIKFRFLSSYFPFQTHSVTLFHPLLQMHAITPPQCLNPGLNGLKAFAAIKRARLIPESIYRNTHTRYAHVHAWRTNNHYFWSPVLMLLFTVERFVAVYRAAKNGSQDKRTHDTTTASFVRQSL